jgi:hypothetical protein
MSLASAQAGLNAIVDQLDGAAGSLEIFSGSAPATAETADSGTLLADFALPAPAFGAAADADPNAVATAEAITGVTGEAGAGGGTVAGYFRVKNNGGTVLWQGSVGGASSGENLELSNTTIASGQDVDVTAWTVTLTEVGS